MYTHQIEGNVRLQGGSRFARSNRPVDRQVFTEGGRIALGVDLHVSYDFAGILPGAMQGFVDVTNLFDRNPPFENAQVVAGNSAAVGGYDAFSGSPIGRVVTVGIRTKF